MQKYDVAAYVWPSYTGDEKRTRIFWQDGFGEWQTVHNSKRNSSMKPSDYEWNRKPLWGYVNEANPDVMEMEIEVAARYGVNVFIYDWYWFDGRPFLENCLNDGYLKARNNDKVKFYLMWANHNVNHLWSVPLAHELEDTVIWRGAVDRTEFEKIVDRTIEKYFKHPSYYKIGGKPVFMIYDLNILTEGFGSAEKTKEALEYFRKKTIEAGFEGLYLQIVSRGPKLEIESPDGRIYDGYRDFGFDGVTEYQSMALAREKRAYDYLEITEYIKKQYEFMSTLTDICYFPHVSVGWDTNPRYLPYLPKVIYNNTPKNVETALRMAKEYIDSHDLPAPLVTINSWNEWTETSYLQPDNLYGYGYLEAVRSVFVDEE